MLFRDLSRNGKLRLTGKDRVRFANGLFTNDVARLRPGDGCHAAMLTVKGKLVADAVVLCDEDAIAIDVAPDLGEKVRAALDRHLIVDDVVIEDETAALDEVGVYGPEARAALDRVFGPIPELPLYGHVKVRTTRVVRVPDLGLPGYRLVGDAHAAIDELRVGSGMPWLSEEAAEVLRVEAGEPRYGVDMGEDHMPIESRLDDAISHTKGCYMGQEVIARATARGHINRKLVGLRLEGEGVASRGARLSAPGRDDAGSVTSSVVSSRFGPIALGYLHRSLWAPGTELSLSDGASVRKAIVSELPFS